MRFKLFCLFLFISTFFSQCNQVVSTDEEDWKKTSTSEEWRDYSLFVQNYPESDKLEEAIHKSILLFKINNGFCGRYNLNFSSYSKDSLLCDGHITSYSSIRETTTKYLVQGISEDYFHQIKTKLPNTNKEVLISKGMFDIELPENGINLHFKKVLIEITKGINDYEKHLAKKWFNKSIDYLSSKERNFINKSVYNRLIFWKHKPFKPTTPQPIKKDSLTYEF